MRHALKKVLITGGTRGIGRALAAALHEEGCEVLVCGRDKEAVGRARDELGVRAVACDVTSPAGRAQLCSVVRGELCGLDLLINNAGAQREHDIMEGLDLEAVRREIALNLLAPIALTDALLPLLLSSPDAAVVNISSALALVPSARAPVYGATKAGLSSWSVALRAQLEKTTVRVVEVVPPLVATAMSAGRQRGAISAERAAEGIVSGLRRGRARIVIGKARILCGVHRLSPALARRVLAAAERS